MCHPETQTDCESLRGTLACHHCGLKGWAFGVSSSLAFPEVHAVS